jgi:hypothetical protein
MDADVVKREIMQAFSAGPQPVWRMPTPTRVELWWKGGYAQIDERETEYLACINSYDQTPSGVPATRFHWVDRNDKGPHKYDDRRTMWGACYVLKANDEKRTQFRFLEDPVFGLIQSKDGPEYWTGVATLDFFYSREVTIHFDLTEGGSIGDLHQWYREFLVRQRELLAQIEPRIREYARWYADQSDLDLKIAGTLDLRRHLNPQALTLYPRAEWDEEQLQVKSKFHWDASWDGEHGCTARLHDWTIIDVGLDYV